MTHERHAYQICLVASFVLVIFAVPITQAVIELVDGETPQCLDIFGDTPTAENLRAYEGTLESDSWFARTLRPLVRYARFVTLRDAGEKAVGGKDGWWFYRPGVRYLIERVRDDHKRNTGHDAALAAIVSFRDRLAARGTKLLIVPVPGKASVYPDRLAARVGRGEAAIHEHTARLVADLRKAGVEVLDAFDALVAERRSESTDRPHSPLYLQRDTHWTRRGLECVARVVASRLVKLGWVSRGTVKYADRTVSVQRQGDVLKMLRTPLIERAFAPQDVSCGQIVRLDTGEAYRDDPNSPVLVLGDSFLRIYERDEPGSAGFIAHLAKELGRPVASIINDGGASTLVRQELARKPELLAGKKLVIWEFVERDIRFGMEGWQEVPLPDREPTTTGATDRDRS